MAEPQIGPTTDGKKADAANGEPEALETHPTGEKQAKENRENDPPA